MMRPPPPEDANAEESSDGDDDDDNTDSPSAEEEEAPPPNTAGPMFYDIQEKIQKDPRYMNLAGFEIVPDVEAEASQGWKKKKARTVAPPEVPPAITAFREEIKRCMETGQLHLEPQDDNSMYVESHIKRIFDNVDLSVLIMVATPDGWDIDKACTWVVECMKERRGPNETELAMLWNTDTLHALKALIPTMSEVGNKISIAGTRATHMGILMKVYLILTGCRFVQGGGRDLQCTLINAIRKAERDDELISRFLTVLSEMSSGLTRKSLGVDKAILLLCAVMKYPDRPMNDVMKFVSMGPKALKENGVSNRTTKAWSESQRNNLVTAFRAVFEQIIGEFRTAIVEEDVIVLSDSE
jgi:hypothetical protein